jgi:hypothetical protein
MVEESAALSKFKVAVEGGGLTMNKEVDQATALAVVNLLMRGEATTEPKPPDGSDENGGGNATATHHRSTRSGAKSSKSKGNGRVAPARGSQSASTRGSACGQKARSPSKTSRTRRSQRPTTTR